jgi:hypothetical protein
MESQSRVVEAADTECALLCGARSREEGGLVALAQALA